MKTSQLDSLRNQPLPVMPEGSMAATPRASMPGRPADRPAIARSRRAAPQAERSYTGPTYYGQSPLKPSKYDALVWGYTYVAGLAGSTQILSTLASFLRNDEWKGMIRNGRHIATAGSAIGGVLLIADLHTPKRWYNMLRIYRPTSPMSLGTYILSSFGVASGIASASHVAGAWRGLRWLQPAAALAQVPAAVAGAGMSTYTGALLAATSTPLWAAAPRLMSARFACSAMATAAAGLSLCEQFQGRSHTARRLDRVALTAALADGVLAVASDRHYGASPAGNVLRDDHQVTVARRLEKGLEHVIPLACYGWNALRQHPSRRLSVMAALGILAGGMLMRATLFKAGNRSAARPRDAMGWTQAAPSSRQKR